ncbi:DUF6622 family protein [Mesorhizobium sp. UC74_2]|uniref:DUF6622 family protein n=1 Tax=Mesorhizobium sp. UC74_2 TaxID=3350171 RepID=UPI00366AC5BC
MSSQAATPSLLAIVTHTPLWVWPLIVYALYAGWARTRDRIISPARLFALPLILVSLDVFELARKGLSMMTAAGLAFGVVAGVLAGLAAARHTPTQALDDGRLAVKGHWLPFAIVLAIVVVSYVRGAALGIDPSLATNAHFLLANAVLAGFLPALMLARTLGSLPRGYVFG